MTRIERTDVRTGIVVETIGGDLRVRGHSGSELLLEGDNPDVSMQNADGPLIIHCGGDCDIRMPEHLSLKVGTVGGDAKITNLESSIMVSNVGSDLVLRHIVGNVTVENVGGDFVAKHIEGDLTVGNVGSDVEIQGVEGEVLLDQVGSDAVLKEIGGSCRCGQVGSDILVAIDFERGNSYHFQAGGEVACVVGAETDAIFVLPRGIEVEMDEDSIDAVVQLQSGNQRIVLGEDGPEVFVQSNAFTLTGSRRQRGFQFEFDAQFGDLERQLNESLSGLGQMLEKRTQEAIDHATAFAKDFGSRISGRGRAGMEERIERQAERAKRHAERHSERMQRHAERHMDRAHRHAERMQRYTRRRDDEGGWAPVSNEERLVILKMLQEGKISVEEAETLLRTLEGKA